MLRLILMTVCLLVVSEACKEHEECPLDLEILENGDLAIEYHSAPGDSFGRVIFKIKRNKNSGGKGSQKKVDTTPEDHEDHEDWGVVFPNNPGTFVPFEECQEISITVRSKTGGTGTLEIKGNKVIPGAACPDA
ncbi:hypothetical protein BSL78_14829 [Apostichopus japonicus]|uniref:Uncharacterized protein n=1 Tax=Stichopus japonicus TaxID=307972 RepID=A0A2G8KK02_STIJA|nr:hypothetical protein BSL78_14829 [Apostichopus japonicus]